jgi:hypothetical protein
VGEGTQAVPTQGAVATYSTGNLLQSEANLEHHYVRRAGFFMGRSPDR